MHPSLGALLGGLILASVLPAVEVPLCGPLTTQVPLAGRLSGGPVVIEARITVPPGAPADLGVGAWVADKDGRWFQRFRPGTLVPGEHRLSLTFTTGDAVSASEGVWSAATLDGLSQGGIFFWTSTSSHVGILVEELVARPVPMRFPVRGRLADVALDPSPVQAGTRWSVRLRPQPVPSDPYDPALFNLELMVDRPDGIQEKVCGFWDQPMRAWDAGDHEAVEPAGPPGFTVRYRPRIPGAHRLRLIARWAGGASVTAVLPDLQVGGPAWDGYLRRDAGDPRFFSRNGAFAWPVGLNLRSVTDSRGTEEIASRPTPDRGTLAYGAYFARLGSQGVDAAEVWMSSWNLALEWTRAWPGFHGAGRYHEANAWRIDRLLDLAQANGMGIQFVLNNHGQGSDNVDREWTLHPYNRANGGWLETPSELFTDPKAKQYQERFRRYLAARYADHPALLGWKLWSEIDLTQPGKAKKRQLLADWHRGAAEDLHLRDIYDHPVTTHWSTSYRSVFPEVARLPELDYLTIDAYHAPEGENSGLILAHLLMAGMNRGKGLGSYGKPVLVSEYGGNWDACPEPQMLAEHASGGFTALVCGYAGAPMLWWYEWVDQGARFAPYRALKAFLKGEDLRGGEAQSIALSAWDEQGDLWARAWTRPGRMLGYVLDPRWQAVGGNSERRGVHVRLGDSIAGGVMELTWWDADVGVSLTRSRLEHPGGPLVIRPPEFARHLAFKLVRVE